MELGIRMKILINLGSWDWQWVSLDWCKYYSLAKDLLPSLTVPDEPSVMHYIFDLIFVMDENQERFEIKEGGGEMTSGWGRLNFAPNYD